jgi:hypothetical protein
MLTLSGITGVPSSALPFMVGQVCFFAMEKAPPGFLICNGAIVSRIIYSELFAAMGTLYGPGDGYATFQLPDLRGEFIRGLDLGRGVDAGRALGSYQSSAGAGGGLAQFESARNPYGENNGGGAENVPADGSWSGWRVTGRSLDGDDHHIRMRNNPAVLGGVFHPRNVALLPCVFVGTPAAINFTAATLGWYPAAASLEAITDVGTAIASATASITFGSNGAIGGTPSSAAWLSALGQGYGVNFEISVTVQSVNPGDTFSVFGAQVTAPGYNSGWNSLSSDRTISAYSNSYGSGGLTTSGSGTVSIRKVGQPGTQINIPFTVSATSNAD